jgi:hypothetical protein
MKNITLYISYQHAVGFTYEQLKKDLQNKLYQYSCNNSTTERVEPCHKISCRLYVTQTRSNVQYVCWNEESEFVISFT